MTTSCCRKIDSENDGINKMMHMLFKAIEVVQVIFMYIANI